MTTTMTYTELRDRQRLELDGLSSIKQPVLFRQTVARQAAELEDAIKADATGDGFIREMFLTELADQEYQYTRDLGSALHALGYSRAWLDSDPRLRHGLDAAVAELRAA